VNKTFDRVIAFKVPAALFPSISKAAGATMVTVSAYIRIAILEKLRHDGIEPIEK
jgi:hypothetical protein